LKPLPLLVRLSRETVRIIRQNIVVFAFGVNLVGVVLTGWLWPLIATSPDWYEKAPLVGVLYHQLGSLLVLLNSMRLLAFDRTAEIGCRGLPDEQRTASTGGPRLRRPGGLTWASSHADGAAPVSDEAVMITGDGDLVEVLATVRYRVSSPRLYLFGNANPDGVIRSSAESVLRELVAGGRFLELLTVRRAALEADARDRLERRLADVAPDGP